MIEKVPIKNSLAEKYSRELLELYRKKNPQPPAVHANAATSIKPMETIIPPAVVESPSMPMETAQASPTAMQSPSMPMETVQASPTAMQSPDTSMETTPPEEMSVPKKIAVIEAANPDAICPDGQLCGYLQVQVTTGGVAIPIKDAQVTVFENIGLDNIAKAFLLTDESGRTPTIALEAPPKELSESPGSVNEPYRKYNVRVTKNGYYPVEDVGVPIFETIKSIQPVELIPLMEFEDNPKATIVFNESEPDL